MRFLSVILTFGLILGITAPSALAANPRTSFTRAEAVALLVDSQPDLKSRLQYYIKNMPPMGLFSDVDTKAWYAPYLETAFEAGIIISNSSKTFRPKAPITTEEAAVMLTRVRNRNPDANVVLIAPGPNTQWYDLAIAEASSSGIFMPYPVRIGQPIRPDDFYAMMASVGVRNPQTIALTINPSVGYLPKPVVVAQAPTTVTPIRTAQAPVRVQPITQPTVQPTYNNTQNNNQNNSQNQGTTQAATDAFTISIPAAGIKDLPVVHPTDPFTSKGLLDPLQNGVGHLFSYPGKSGKILIYGHSSSYPWDVSPYTKIFRQINQLNPGDKIYVTYEGEQFTYEVTHEEAVPATDMSRYQSDGTDQLILYTCWPPDSISQRYLVYAKPI